MITTSVVRSVAALPSRLEVRSEIASGYSYLAHTGNSAHGLLELGTMLWAFGPTDASWAFCSYSWDDQALRSGSCNEAPSTLVGIASGGMWLTEDADQRVRFYRPAEGKMTVVEGLELPAFDWTRGGVPWALDPDDATRLLVPRVDGERLIIDRYLASAGHTWVGATEQWVFETDGTSTRVRSR